MCLQYGRNSGTYKKEQWIDLVQKNGILLTLVICITQGSHVYSTGEFLANQNERRMDHTRYTIKNVILFTLVLSCRGVTDLYPPRI